MSAVTTAMIDPAKVSLLMRFKADLFSRIGEINVKGRRVVGNVSQLKALSEGIVRSSAAAHI